MTKTEKGKWTYQVRSPSGEVDAAAPSGVNVAECFNCHKKGEKTDYLLGTAEKN